jgi:hypothetical protein
LYAAKSQEEAFKRFIGLGDEVDLSARTGAMLETFLLFDEAKPAPALEYRSTLIKDKKFPSVRNVEILFRRLGIPRIFQALSRRSSTDVELALRAFMDVRNALAHESPPSITHLDVARYFTQVEVWIEAIDREFYGHVVRSSGSNYWS